MADTDLDDNNVDIFNNIIDNGTASIHVSHILTPSQPEPRTDDTIDIFM